jgi:colicin import membrane protein
MVRAQVVVLVALLGACSSGSGHNRNLYDDRYRRYEHRRVDPAALERHQDRERERLERQQENARDRLQRQQRRERREEKQAGEWDAGDKREQSKVRRQQERRFEEQDRRLREHQVYERDIYE